MDPIALSGVVFGLTEGRLIGAYELPLASRVHAQPGIAPSFSSGQIRGCYRP